MGALVVQSARGRRFAFVATVGDAMGVTKKAPATKPAARKKPAAKKSAARKRVPRKPAVADAVEPSATKPIEAATLAELERLNVVGKPASQVALRLARRLDDGAGVDGGSAVAAIAKELRATLEGLARVSKPKADPVDELKRARARRQAAQRRKRA